jgi:hypothetical protein
MLDITEAVYGMYGLGLGWILMGILGLTRTLLDLAHISRRSVFMTGLIGWSIPLGCIGLCFLLIWYQGEVPTLTFFWHLVTRN